ncbi:MAG TPA: hypothetical protein PLA69_00330 [Flavobacterium sp.]|nr:hypothetical protein [Flavobacterium sp.]
MSPRWKHQTRVGLLWAVIMTVLMTAWDALMGEPFKPLFCTIRTFVFAVGGIFLVGYFSWKGTLKKQ